METPLDVLIREAKNENTINSYLKLYQFYKTNQKHFSAQQTLERCLKIPEFQPNPLKTDEFSAKLLEIKQSYSEIKNIPINYNPELFIVYSLLGDVTLLLKEPLDAFVYLSAAYSNYTNPSVLNSKIMANVVFCGLIESFLSITLKFLYNKEYKQTIVWKEYTDWLIKHIKNSEEYTQSSEKLELMIGNFYFILFTWFGRNEDFELCEKHAGTVKNPEIQFILGYYRDKPKAKEYIKELIMKNPGISNFWTWLSFVEEDYSRKNNAIAKALQIDKKNWTAWVALGIIQASKGDFVSSAKTWKIAHYFNHLDPKLWVLSAFLYNEANLTAKSIQSFKLACDLDPSMWISIDHYLTI